MVANNSLSVVKVTIEAPVVSFRYPHFLIGRQPTFDMPPPSTIIGHIASALGEWPDFPLQFAYSFTYRSRCSDLEHQHIIERKGGDFPGKIQDPHWREPVPEPGKKLTKDQKKPKLLQRTTEATVQPHLRDFLFDVRLELFLAPADLESAFRSPVFTVVLGRSQDLACVRSIRRMELERATSGYVEHTILPVDFRRRLPWGITSLMPQHIDPTPERLARFAPYIVLRERVYLGMKEIQTQKTINTIDGTDEEAWFVDPDAPEDRGARKLLWFHSADPRERLHESIR